MISNATNKRIVFNGMVSSGANARLSKMSAPIIAKLAPIGRCALAAMMMPVPKIKTGI